MIYLLDSEDTHANNRVDLLFIPFHYQHLAIVRIRLTSLPLPCKTLAILNKLSRTRFRFFKIVRADRPLRYSASARHYCDPLATAQPLAAAHSIRRDPCW